MAAPLVQRFAVSFEYPVFFTERVLDPANPALVLAISRRESSRRHRAVVVVDGNLAACWPALEVDLHLYFEAHSDRLALEPPIEILPGGEDVKNQPYLIDGLQASLQARGIDRHSVVVIIGGGAVLDAAGFAAATTHRGVRVVRVPTTVLAQCDGGVGVKTGVNAYGAKNFLGTFTPPFAVINDHTFLSTLDPRDRRAGLAECVKVGLIKDPELFGWIEAHAAELRAGGEALRVAVRRGAELHLAHIREAGDPFEMGTARPLDFGHWSAHKLEILTDHDLRHGEAVAIGMALDSRYAHDAGLLRADELRQVVDTIEALGLPLWHEALGRRGPDGRLLIERGLDEFREHLGGELSIPMLTSIGRSREIGVIDPRRLEGALRWLEARARG